MGRPHRTDPEDGWHHVMNRGVDHGTIFFDDIDRVEFGRLLGLVHERFGVEIHAYCLVGNHYHLLLRCPDGRLSEAMHLLGSLFARFINDRRGRDGPLFKSRFTSRWITTQEYLANVVRYVHRNALDVAGVRHPREYRWSSHRAYLGVRRSPSWLETSSVSSWFSDAEAFDAFVGGDLDESCRTSGSGRSILAASEMIVREQSTSRRRTALGEARALTLLTGDQATVEIAADVHLVLGVQDGALRAARWRANRLAGDPRIQSMLAAVRDLTAA